MENLIEQLKNKVTEESKNSNFLHNEWFAEYHLNIVEKIALELCDIYPATNREVVRTLVWIHDYGKILDMSRQHELNNESEKLLLSLGFDVNFTKTVMDYLEIFESKMTADLNEAPIEVKIVSSADGASHLIGPFMSIYWKEFSHKTIPELLKANKDKLYKDWDRKIVLQEVKKAFQERHNLYLEISGDLPNKFL